jgi:ATP synthase protein I
MDFKWLRDYADYFYLGLIFPSSMIVGTLLGFLADRWFGTHPWGKMIGLFLGLAAGTVNFIRDFRRLQRKK